MYARKMPLLGVILSSWALFCLPANAQTTSVIAMGASTGGQAVFERVLVDLDDCLVAGWNFPPIVIVQHGQSVIDSWVQNDLPPLMTALTIELVPVPSSLPAVGAELQQNTVYFAPADHHIGVVRENGTYKIKVSDEAPEGDGGLQGSPTWRPSVDYLFRHVADAVDDAGGTDYATGYVLTGQWGDGTFGLQDMADAVANNRRRVQSWSSPNDTAEYFGSQSMPQNAWPHAEESVIAGQIIQDLFPMIQSTHNSLLLGDVNFDGVFDSADLVLAFQHGEFDDYDPKKPDPTKINNSTWTEGDWNGDREFDQADLDDAQGGYSGSRFSGLPITHRNALTDVLRSLHKANAKMDTLVRLLALDKSELEQILE